MSEKNNSNKRIISVSNLDSLAKPIKDYIDAKSFDIGIDGDGYWTNGGKRILDANGNPIKASNVDNEHISYLGEYENEYKLYEEHPEDKILINDVYRNATEKCLYICNLLASNNNGTPQWRVLSYDGIDGTKYLLKVTYCSFYPEATDELIEPIKPTSSSNDMYDGVSSTGLNGGKWHRNAIDGDNYMSQKVYSNDGDDNNDEWGDPILIKGQKGVDGKYTEFIYLTSSEYPLSIEKYPMSVYNQAYPANDYQSDKRYQQSDYLPQYGGVKWLDDFEDVSDAKKYIYISKRTFAPELKNNAIGEYQVTWSKFSEPKLLSTYLKGEDGKDIEFIYKLVKDTNDETLIDEYEKLNPVNWKVLTSEFQLGNQISNNEFNNNEYIPDGWTDDPGQTNIDTPIQIISKRVRGKNGIWGKFCKPSSWSAFVNGIKSMQDEYVRNNETSYPEGDISTWSETEANKWNWIQVENGDLKSVLPTSTNKYLWNREKIISTLDGTVTFSDPHIIKVYSEVDEYLTFKSSQEYFYTTPNQGDELPSTKDLNEWSETSKDANYSDVNRFLYNFTNIVYTDYDGIDVSKPSPIKLLSVWGQKGEPGKDGSSKEYIFHSSTTPLSFTENYWDEFYANNKDQQAQWDINDFVPNSDIEDEDERWYNNSPGVTMTKPYVYMSSRTKRKENGVVVTGSPYWGQFSTPKLWSHYGLDGSDIEFIFHLGTLEDEPVVPTYYSVGDFQNDEYLPNYDEDTPLYEQWTDDPIKQTTDYPIIYASKRVKIKQDTEDENAERLWGPFCDPYIFGTKSNPIIGLTELYALSASKTEAPSLGDNDTPRSVLWTTDYLYPNKDTQYLWNVEKIAFGDGGYKYDNPHVIRSYDDNIDKKFIDTKEQYASTTQRDMSELSGVDWLTEESSVNFNDQYRFLWNKTINTYEVPNITAEFIDWSTESFLSAVNQTSTNKKYLWLRQNIEYKPGIADKNIDTLIYIKDTETNNITYINTVYAAVTTDVNDSNIKTKDEGGYIQWTNFSKAKDNLINDDTLTYIISRVTATIENGGPLVTYQEVCSMNNTIENIDITFLISDSEIKPLENDDWLKDYDVHSLTNTNKYLYRKTIVTFGEDNETHIECISIKPDDSDINRIVSGCEYKYIALNEGVTPDNDMEGWFDTFDEANIDTDKSIWCKYILSYDNLADDITYKKLCDTSDNIISLTNKYYATSTNDITSPTQTEESETIRLIAVWGERGNTGKDGENTEYIFLNTADDKTEQFANMSNEDVVSYLNTFSDIEYGNETERDWVPEKTIDNTKWLDNSPGATPTKPYVWYTKRQSKDSKWYFDFGKPSLWVHYGIDGRSIKKVENLYIATKEGLTKAQVAEITTGWDTIDIANKKMIADNNGVADDGVENILKCIWQKTITTYENNVEDDKDITYHIVTTMDKSIDHIEELYIASSNDSVPDEVDDKWDILDNAEVTKDNKFLWKKMTVVYNDGDKESHISLAAIRGDDGKDSKTSNYIYKLTTTNSCPTAFNGTKDDFETAINANEDTNGWTADPTGVDKDNKYEWISISTSIINDNDSLTWSDYSDASLWSSFGTDGKPGEPGVGIQSVTIYHTVTDTLVETNTFTDNDWIKDEEGISLPVAGPGEYLWTKTVTIYTNANVDTSYSYVYMGVPGERGPIGKLPMTIEWSRKESLLINPLYSTKDDSTYFTQVVVMGDDQKRYVYIYEGSTLSEITLDTDGYQVGEDWSGGWTKVQAQDFVIADYLEANQAFINNLTASSIETATSGKRVIINKDGINAYNDTDDEPVISTTSEGNIKLSGNVDASSLTVEAANINGRLNAKQIDVDSIEATHVSTTLDPDTQTKVSITGGTFIATNIASHIRLWLGTRSGVFGLYFMNTSGQVLSQITAYGYEKKLDFSADWEEVKVFVSVNGTGIIDSRSTLQEILDSKDVPYPDLLYHYATSGAVTAEEASHNGEYSKDKKWWNKGGTVPTGTCFLLDTLVMTTYTTQENDYDYGTIVGVNTIYHDTYKIDVVTFDSYGKIASRNTATYTVDDAR